MEKFLKESFVTETNKVKKVLWISDFFPRPHDMTTGIWALESAFALKRQGVEVVALAPTPWIPHLLAWTPQLKDWAKVPASSNFEGLEVHYPKCLHYPHRLVAKYLYTPIPYFDSSLVWQGCRKVVEELMEQHAFQAVHANFLFPSGFIGLEIKKRYKVPLVVHERSLTRLLAAYHTPVRRKLYTHILRSADQIITLNCRMEKLLVEMIQTNDKIKVVRDGAEINVGKEGIPKGTSINIVPSAGNPLQNAYGAKKPAAYENKKVVLCVASFMERKGQVYLVEAIAQAREHIPNLKCILIGSGQYLKRVKALAAKLSLDGIVEFYGQCPHEKVLETMSWCDVFILPSWDEPGGTVYGEAMTFGKPIIACRGEGITEVLEEGKQGLFVEKKDAASIAAALEKILTNDALAIEMGQHARHFVEEEWNYEHLAEKIIRIYNSINTARDNA